MNRRAFTETPRLPSAREFFSPGTSAISATWIRLIVPLGKEGDVGTLGLLAVVLIVLWLLGSLAFHVSAGMIHILLVVGIVLLFHQGRYQNSKGGRRAPPSGNASTARDEFHFCVCR